MSKEKPFARKGNQVYVDHGPDNRYSVATVNSGGIVPMNRMIACANACEGIDPASVPALIAAALGVVWKLNRTVSPSGKGGDCVPARIDINDATVRELQAAISKARPDA